LAEDIFEPPRKLLVAAEDIPGELERLNLALAQTRGQIESLQRQIIVQAGADEAAIFEAHLLMLEDQEFLAQVRRRIRESPEAAEGAFYAEMSRYVERLRSIDDEYLRERTLDMEDVARRVVRNLTGQGHAISHDTPHILVAHELTPSAAAAMDRSLVLGLITESGSYTAHSAILARSMGIPAVVGLHHAASRFHPGHAVLLDGYQGVVIVHPSEETRAEYAITRRQKVALDRHLEEMRDAPSVTLDGRSVILSANIEFRSEMAQVAAVRAQGVGLYRTEFFYLNRHDLPGEDEQAEEYARVAEDAGAHGVIIRTLDVGGDKLHVLSHHTEENNPFLGWRGIRVSLSELGLFKTQLRAILRASARGKLRVMFPMVSGLSELRAARAALDEARMELRAEGIPFDENLEVGCMIEIPSAALIADVLAKDVDFFSIGTNDLIQYTIAVDRGNDRVADLYQPCHPSIIRLMKHVADSGRSAGIWTGVCGEMAGDVLLTPLMVGLGFEELSVATVSLPYVKYAIRKLNARRCGEMVADLLTMADADKIYDRVRETALEYYPELLA
jgi:phosphotransferase system enzyme I (PtsI)